MGGAQAVQTDKTVLSALFHLHFFKVLMNKQPYKQLFRTYVKTDLKSRFSYRKQPHPRFTPEMPTLP